jgi:small subunit ribosomal protein S20
LANHPSAKKRHRQSLLRRTRSRSAKSNVGGMVRKVNEAVTAGDKQAAETELRTASIALAKAASKGFIHSRNASRRVARLATKVGRLS